ncbi:hypothetical protein HID58_059704 [Brassica napus]|uniref:Uncharacterized protein n=1 Tax=Brassica napus TaxID=3708 RepID=A0ABQ7ZTT3_BRANA|nr:hypothetical protein HID58_059704 [Brassica napus]
MNGEEMEFSDSSSPELPPPPPRSKLVVSSLTAWLKHRGWRRTANGGEFEVSMVEVDVGFNS